MKYGSLQLQVFILHPFASDTDKIRKEMFLGFDTTCSSCHRYHLFRSCQILAPFRSAISETFSNVSNKEIWNRAVWSSARMPVCHVTRTAWCKWPFCRYRYGECWLTGNLSNHHHTVNVQEVGLHVLDIPQGAQCKHSLDAGGLSSLILNIQALSKHYAWPSHPPSVHHPSSFFPFFTCTQLVSAMCCFRYVHLHACTSVCVYSLAFLVAVVLIAAICVVKANKFEPWKLNDEISKQTKTHAGLLHSQLLCIYMGKTPAPRVCGGPFRGQYYNTVN